MVASTNGEVYVPFTRVPIVEEGFQSSEDGSELHSPVFDGSYTPEEFPYQLSRTLSTLAYAPDAQLYMANWERHYGPPDAGMQVHDSHMLPVFQLSTLAIDHELPHQFNHELSLHENPMVDFDPSAGRFQPNALTPTADYAFGLPQSRLPEPQYRVSHDMLNDSPASYSSRHDVSTASVSSTEQAAQITLASTAAKSPGTNSGSTSPSSSRPPRREASTVVIACRQCRARKIRCDSTRPVCHNCTRRNNECEYDAVPKRRGPDKRPGTRQRSCKKRPTDAATVPTKKKRKSIDESVDSFAARLKENGDDVKPHLSLSVVHDSHPHMSHSSSPLDASIQPRSVGPDLGYARGEYSSSRRLPLSLDFSGLDSVSKPYLHRQYQDDQSKATFIQMSPSVEYSRRSWWDHLLRERSLGDIMDDLNILLTSSSYWLSFIHIPTFFRDLQDPEQRLRMQPAFIMSALALSTLIKSSDLELGAEGRSRAIHYRDNAQALLEVACSSQLVDYTLAEAALILALFESSCHPQYSPERAVCSLQFLDRIIQVLSLCTLDDHDPDTSIFSPRAVPAVFIPESYRPPKRCCCVVSAQSVGSNPMDGYHSYSSVNPPWNPNWSDAEIRKEECRRLCWVALALVASYTFQCSAFQREPMQFALSEPANYTLLFPGEAYERALGHDQLYGQSPKDSLWAVYCRSLLLWCSSIRPIDDRWSVEQRSRSALEVLAETRTVQAALDMHQCNVDGSLVNVCKEYLYNTRLTVSYELRRIQDIDSAGMFDRRQAEEWLYYQEQMAKSLKAAVLQLGETPGYLLSRRPFQINWISSQVMICLGLWKYDRSLTHALELAKTFLIPLDVLNALWPSAEQRMRRDELRRRIEDACISVRLPPPLPAQLTLPPILRA